MRHAETVSAPWIGRANRRDAGRTIIAIMFRGIIVTSSSQMARCVSVQDIILDYRKTVQLARPLTPVLSPHIRSLRISLTYKRLFSSSALCLHRTNISGSDHD